MEFKALALERSHRFTKRSNAERIEFVQQFKQSGQTQASFCKDHGINNKTFAGWLNRFPSCGISSVSLQPQPTMKFGQQVKVCLPCGVHVELQAVFEPASMVSFLQELAQCKLN